MAAMARRFLVTAGNTREMIDRVRDWGNVFTGNTGFSVARALATIGTVDLLTSNETHAGQAATIANLHASTFRSHEDLVKALDDLLRERTYDAIFMTAAVADYRPSGTFAVTSREPTGTPGEERWIVRDVQAIAVLGTPTEKIVDLFRSRWQFKGLLVKFKLEVGIEPAKLIEIGQASRKASGADYLVANTLDMVTGEQAGAFLLSDAGEEWVARGQLAERLKKLV
jgi:phosphopantothenoylcysteine synthetase/decarboxylase